VDRIWNYGGKVLKSIKCEIRYDELTKVPRIFIPIRSIPDELIVLVKRMERDSREK